MKEAAEERMTVEQRSFHKEVAVRVDGRWSIILLNTKLVYNYYMHYLRHQYEKC